MEQQLIQPLLFLDSVEEQLQLKLF